MSCSKSTCGGAVDSAGTCYCDSECVAYDDCCTNYFQVCRKKRTRKEMRDLRPREWNRIVEAMWIMKKTDTTLGKRLYGSHFISYDDLVLKHMRLANSRRGDLAHFIPAFPFVHRIWLLEFEDSLRAVDNKINAIPFWDPQRQGSIFTEEYLGDAIGDPNNNYEIRNGKFASWNIFKAARSDKIDNFTNGFGYLRSPLSVNKSPFLSRRAGSMCGITLKIQSVSEFEGCTHVDFDINAWMKCADPSIHGRYLISPFDYC